LSACYYQQVEGDSGSGATLGDFNGRTIGAGPVVSYTKKIGGHDTVFEFKWLHEFETKNRLEVIFCGSRLSSSFDCLIGNFAK